MGNNFSARIMNTAVRALSAQQAVIANIGNNIANVNTPNYCRRILTLETAVSNSVSGNLQLGSGVAFQRSRNALWPAKNRL